MTAPAENPTQGWAAEAIYPRRWRRMASLARFGARELPTLRLAAGLSGPARASVGSVRDYVLGAQLVNGRGELLVPAGKSGASRRRAASDATEPGRAVPAVTPPQPQPHQPQPKPKQHQCLTYLLH